MDYNMLVGSKGVPGAVSTWTNNSRIAQDIPEIVLEAESWIYRRLRHWRMISAPLLGTLTVGADFISLPSDLLEPSFLTLTGVFQQEIYQRTAQDVMRAWNFDGSGNRVQQQPLMYYFDQFTLRFDSPPDQAYATALLYFQQPVPLASSISNFLTVYYPRLLRLTCMAAACEWLKDFGQGTVDRTYYDQLAQDELEKAQVESDRARRAIQASAYVGNYQGYGYGFG